MTNKGLQQDMTKLKASFLDILGDVQLLSKKFKENQKRIHDIVEENKVIEQKFDGCCARMLVVVEDVSNLSEKVATVVDEDHSEEWDFYPEGNYNNRTEDSSEVDTEQIAADPRDRNSRLKISVGTQNNNQGNEVLIQATSSNAVADDESNKGNGVVTNMSMCKSLERSNEAVTVDKSNKEKEKYVTSNDVRKKKSTQMMRNQTGPDNQNVEDESSNRHKHARTKRVLNQSVIDCEYVLKKGVVKERQVMTPKKIKTEAAHLLNLVECNICTKSFTSAAPLAAHLKNHSRGIDMLDCPFPFCSHRGNQLKLTQHMRSKHTREKLFSCYSCSVQFATLDAKTAHEKKHSQPSFQQCGKCSRFYNVVKGSCRCCKTQN